MTMFPVADALTDAVEIPLAGMNELPVADALTLPELVPVPLNTK
jgi:hypothetical protein